VKAWQYDGSLEILQSRFKIGEQWTVRILQPLDMPIMHRVKITGHKPEDMALFITYEDGSKGHLWCGWFTHRVESKPV
jgi:hypothetical protein